MKKFAFLALIILLIFPIIGCSDDPDNPSYVGTYWMDENDVANPYETINGMPRVATREYLISIAEGDVANHVEWFKYGYNPNVGTSREVVWSYSTTPYNTPAAEIQMEVVSSDNTQDLAGGTGCLQVTIEYLDDTYIEHSTTVNLNGTTAVLTAVSDIFVVNDMYSSSVGSSQGPVGNISLRGVGGGLVYAYMLATSNTARSAVYTVPDGKTLYISSATASTGDAAKGVQITFVSDFNHINDTLTTIYYAFREYISYNSFVGKIFEIPIKIPEHGAIVVTAVSAQAGAIAEVTMAGWLEDN